MLSGSTYVPYSGSDISLDSSGAIITDTSIFGLREVYIKAETDSGSKAYLPVKINVIQQTFSVDPKVINIPPFFEKVPMDGEVLLDFTKMEEGGIMRYYLPRLDDTPGDTPYVLSANMEDFM